MPLQLSDREAAAFFAQINRPMPVTYDVDAVALEAVQEALREPSSTWFADWMLRHHLDDAGASDALGCRRVTIRACREGGEIPKYIALACAAFSYGLPPMGFTT